jgi:cell division protein FtsI (penicillin-binding protein 3)
MKKKPFHKPTASAASGVKKRTVVIGVFFSLLFAAVAAQAVYLQVIKGDWLSRKAEFQYQKSLTAQGKRGTIYDTRMREMAVSVDTTSIGVHPRLVENPARTARSLARLLDVNRSNLEKNLRTDNSFVWIKRHAAPKDVEAVRQLDLPGIAFVPEHSRYYPNCDIAAQVIGFSGVDGQGLEGVEYIYNDYLKGKSSQELVMTDALGRGFDSRQKLLANYAGNNLILTIDKTIQYIAENALVKAAQKHRAESGVAVVMDPKTGAILAMAHYPTFNPNAFGQYKRGHYRNRAITDPFEPGSIMKIFLAAAALDSGICTPSTIFFCENGNYRIDRNVVHDVHPRGWLSLQQIIKYSSNIGTVKISEKIGKSILHNQLTAFGFGKKTGIDCPGETGGRLSAPSRWSKIDTGAISFGQGVSASALQLITATSAIANDGVLMQPYIVKAVTDNKGRLLHNFGPRKVSHAISVKTARTVRRIMESVTTDGGTGTNAAIDGYAVCGKTGTAQKIDESGAYARDKFVASFLGFAPCNSPEIVVLVTVDEPQKGHYGGVVAAPAFKAIVSETLNYLDIVPEQNLQPEWDKQPFTVAKLTGSMTDSRGTRD